MAPEQKKRARPVPKSSQLSKKRQKIERATSNAAANSTKLPVALDELLWNEVDIPDMFEDAEGFFGLEEVDGVEVVRDGNTVRFISSQSCPTSEEEFEGFSDEEITFADVAQPDKVVGKHAENLVETDRNKKKNNKRQLSESKVKEADPASKLEKNLFLALDGHDTSKEVDVSAWVELDLSSATLTAISKLGFTKPTPIQAASIPEVLGGHDVIGKAPTGSGKTLAFGIPILEKWLEAKSKADNERDPQIKKPTALILSPTRELAHQLSEHITALCSGISDAPYVAAVTGGLSLHKQQRQLLKADIVIGTPGRLWEVMSSSIEVSNSFKNIDFLIIDEADRLLADGYFKEADEIISSLDRSLDLDESNVGHTSRQTLVFSATFHKGLQQKLAGKARQGLTDTNESMEYLLKKLNFQEDKPMYIDVNPVSQMVEGLKEGMVECSGTEKDLYLYSLLLYHPNQRTLVFTNSIHSVRRLTPLLQNLNLPANALHSQMAQKARLRSIERFSSPISTSSILVATDVAARGLDISGVRLVIHYHLPRSADMYVHRSGRTARAATSGSSILLCAPEEVVGTRRLVAKVHAQNAIAGEGNKSKYYMRLLNLDRKVVARLRSRVALAKRIADSVLAKEKKSHDGDWIHTAAKELGVDYDSDEFEAASVGRTGREAGRKRKEKAARELTRGELDALKGELTALLRQRVNVGVSAKYLASGVVDVDELLHGAQGNFLGRVNGIGLED